LSETDQEGDTWQTGAGISSSGGRGRKVTRDGGTFISRHATPVRCLIPYIGVRCQRRSVLVITVRSELGERRPTAAALCGLHLVVGDIDATSLHHREVHRRVWILEPFGAYGEARIAGRQRRSIAGPPWAGLGLDPGTDRKIPSLLAGFAFIPSDQRRPWDPRSVAAALGDIRAGGVVSRSWALRRHCDLRTTVRKWFPMDSTRNLSGAYKSDKNGSVSKSGSSLISSPQPTPPTDSRYCPTG
jgi:hypothetical protein